jgi:hypothetical protein
MDTPLNYGVLGKRVGLVALVATVINVLLGIIGKAVSAPPETFGPYMTSSIAFLTLVGTIGAGVVYAAMRAYFKDVAKTNHYFLWLSGILLVLSFYPDIALPWSPEPDDIGWTYGIIGNLMLMHVVAAGLVMYYFTRPE